LANKAAALANAELALAPTHADLFARLQASPDKLTSTEQLTYVKTNPGLNRGGNTSPGLTQAYSDSTVSTKLWDGTPLAGWEGETDAWSIETTPSTWTRRRRADSTTSISPAFPV
jgi:hypothetical protein